MKLNLGCGLNHLVNYVNVDIEPMAIPDRMFDIQREWPVLSCSVEHIVANHIVEHLQDIKTFFQEAYRVLDHDCEMEIHVPHHCSENFWGDPTHVRPITETMMHLLSAEFCAMCKEKGYSNTPLATYWQVDFELVGIKYVPTDRWKGQPEDMIRAAMASQINVLSEVHFKLRAKK